MSDDLSRLRRLAGLPAAPVAAPATLREAARPHRAQGLRHYLNEDDGDKETLGTNRNDAVKSIQARMGTDGKPGNPQDATRTLNSLMATGAAKQNGGKIEMDPMGDDEFKSAIGEDKNFLLSLDKGSKAKAKKKPKARRAN